MSDENPFGEVIYAFTRAQALEDGVLVDVSTTAREAGIRLPTALTRAVYDAYVEVPAGVDGQDVNGRLWDILWMFRCRARNCPADQLSFQLYVRNNNQPALSRRDLVTLKAVIGPGDTEQPVITIMLPDED